VADEVRSLSQLSGDTGRNISQKISAVNEAITGAFAAAEASAGSDNRAIADADAAIHEVLESFGRSAEGLVGAAATLRESNFETQGEVERAIVELQFQDRTSQILSHIHDSLGSTAEQLAVCFAAREAGKVQVFAAEGLLEQLEASYAMAEERGNHSGEDAQEAGGITFF
jgi:methyl-accepting chemotaxis protein